jgi:hypothetical protein
MNTETIISQQPSAVQTLCQQFTQSYQKNRKLMGSWGKLLQEIRDGLTVSTEFAESSDPQGSTFSAICRELGIPRSTAYHYINMFLITSTYPQWLQDAATPANLNLALEHVQNAYEDIRASLPTDPNAFELQGIIGKLKEAKPTREEAEPITREAFVESLAKLIKRALKVLPADSVVAAVDQALVAAKVPAAQREAVTHAALDVVDQGLGIDTKGQK